MRFEVIRLGVTLPKAAAYRSTYRRWFRAKRWKKIHIHFELSGWALFVGSLGSAAFKFEAISQLWPRGCPPVCWARRRTREYCQKCGCCLEKWSGWTTVLHRPQWWAENNNVLIVTQFGFRNNHRTTDPMLINPLIQHYKERKKVFACFKKTFDSIIPLMEKIANLGCSTTILTSLLNMYRNAVSVVCLDGEHSAWSTPVQFVFLSDLEEFDSWKTGKWKEQVLFIPNSNCYCLLMI